MSDCAVISPCGRYRYRLERDVMPYRGHVVAFFGVNPSTADALAEDATTRKWAGFCRKNGWRRYIAGNPFAFRATNVKELAGMSDPMGPDNFRHIMQIIADADILVPCWGSRNKIPKELHHHLLRLKRVILDSGKPVRIFGLTKSGDPMHPLMLGYDTPLVEWRDAA